MNQLREVSSRIFNNQYTIKKKISSGSFGIVFLGFDKVGKEEIAIKVEKEDNEEVKSLEREVQVLQKIQGIQGIPKLHWHGQDQEFTVIVIQLLGKDLAFQMKALKKFSLKTILLLTVQLVTILQKMHVAGVIHRDLKPENILLGRDSDQSTVYLVDFGISKIYRDLNGKHIPFRENKPFIGTTRYASIAAHKGNELSRKDDLESLIYVMLFFFKGNLPWQNMNVPDKERTKAVGELKQKYLLSDLCKDLPNQFIKIIEQEILHIYLSMRYLRGLHFKDEPDYDLIISLFMKAAEENKILFDNIFDWTDPNSMKKYLTQDSKMSLNKQNSNLDKKMSNQMLWSVNDQHHVNSQNNLLLPPDMAGRHNSLAQRQESRHPTNQSVQSSIQGSYSSMQMKYVPSIMNIEKIDQIPEQQGAQKLIDMNMKSDSKKNIKKKKDAFSSFDNLYSSEIDENLNDPPLCEKYKGLRKQEVLSQFHFLIISRCLSVFQQMKSSMIVLSQQ